MTDTNHLRAEVERKLRALDLAYARRDQAAAEIAVLASVLSVDIAMLADASENEKESNRALALRLDSDYPEVPSGLVRQLRGH